MSVAVKARVEEGLARAAWGFMPLSSREEARRELRRGFVLAAQCDGDGGRLSAAEARDFAGSLDYFDHQSFVSGGYTVEKILRAQQRLGATCFYRWRELAPGIEYRRVVAPYPAQVDDYREVHLFRVDLDKALLKPVLAREAGRGPAAYVEELLQPGPSLLVNGSYFSPDFRPTGLLARGGAILFPVNPHAARASLLLVEDGRARLVPVSAAVDAARADFALQGAATLIVDGQVAASRGRQARPEERAAVALTQSGRLVFAQTYRATFFLDEFAGFLREAVQRPDDAVTDAIALDGGTSTQFIFQNGDLRIERHGLFRIPVAIGVFPR